MQKMTILRAPAKINLSLRILGRREDGYHEVVTRMQKVELYDSITLGLTDNPGISFECDDKTIPAGQDNLAVRAAILFLAETGIKERRGISIKLEKRIPVAAGLGGGSSDAGTVLQGLNSLLECPLTEVDLLRLARSLGADVPFFTVPASAVWATGRGDELLPAADLGDVWILLVNPGFAVPTKWVFDNFALTSIEKNSRLRGSQNGSQVEFFSEDMHNDLEKVTVSRYPVVGEIKESLLEAGADAALMSGSGPTVFGLFKKRDDGRTSLSTLREQFSEVYKKVWLIRACTGA